ncbi:heparanase-like isoform X2 [Corticium candelabrum]|uniref:heparanase-like isoform X2 n=1 Tax=Corticium candelabrum TaxID=121492 RepID=UPI002E264AA7|nr:heparanase-like isoform X2 [Corticium candelabrum]
MAAVRDFLISTAIFSVCSSFQLVVETKLGVFAIPRHFLSIASSPKTPCHDRNEFQKILHSGRFTSLVRGLSPAYWRVGGTEGQEVSYYSTQSECKSAGIENGEHMKKDFEPLCLTQIEWDELNGLVVKTNTTLLFDLSNIKRHKDGTWNYSNVEKLLNYSAAKGYNIAWQLGNEPHAYPDHFNVTVEPKQSVDDFKTLRKFVRARQIIVGLESTNPYEVKSDVENYEYLTQWISSGGLQFVNALSWHQYFIRNPNPTVEQMHNASILDSLLLSIQTLKSCTKGYKVDYWLTETGSILGSDAVHNISGSYAAGFMWLYKLGLAARMGHSVVCHQTLFTDSRGLMDPTNFTPFVSYWVSYLFKHLVGSVVLNVDGQLNMNQSVRSFAFCTQPNDTAIKRSYMAGDVTLILINIQTEKPATIQLVEPLSQFNVDVYLLTPGIGGITSNFTLLNGDKLEMSMDNQLPMITPTTQANSQTISLPPLTYGFYVIQNAKAEACLSTI